MLKKEQKIQNKKWLNNPRNKIKICPLNGNSNKSTINMCI